MKKLTLPTILLCALFLVNCSTEEISTLETNKNPNFRVIEKNSNQSRDSYNDPCNIVDLIAGQHMVAGTMSIDANEEDIILTYRTNEDWSIKETHLSLGDCDILTFPTTGADNPKIGHFEHSTSHNEAVREVSYYINKEAVTDIYCFAAHAVVQGVNGKETAWAEGIDFGGKSWAMYVEANKSDCDIAGGPLK